PLRWSNCFVANPLSISSLRLSVDDRQESSDLAPPGFPANLGHFLFLRRVSRLLLFIWASVHHLFFPNVSFPRNLNLWASGSISFCELPLARGPRLGLVMAPSSLLAPPSASLL